MSVIGSIARTLHRMGEAVFGESWATEYMGSAPVQEPGATSVSPRIGVPDDKSTAWYPSIPDDRQKDSIHWSRAVVATGVPHALNTIFQSHTVGDVFRVHLKPKESRDTKAVEKADALLQQWLRQVGLDRQMWAQLCGRKVIDGSIPNYLLPSDAGPRCGIFEPTRIAQYGVNDLRRVAWLDIPRSEIDLTDPSVQTEDVRLDVITEGQEFDATDPNGICVADFEHPEIHPLGCGVIAPLVLYANRDERHQEAELRKAIATGSVYAHAKVTASSGQSNEDAVDKAIDQLGTTLPSSGSILTFSDNVDLSMSAPQMALYEHEAGIRGTETRMAMIAGVSPTWLGIGVDVNRASAAEMGSPAERRMAQWRADFRAHVSAIAWAGLYYLRAMGILVIPEETYEIVVLMPDLAPSDTEQLVNSLATTLTILDMMAGNQWLTSETAQAIALERLSHLTDVPLDAATEGTPGKRGAEEQRQRESLGEAIAEARRAILRAV